VGESACGFWVSYRFIRVYSYSLVMNALIVGVGRVEKMKVYNSYAKLLRLPRNANVLACGENADINLKWDNDWPEDARELFDIIIFHNTLEKQQNLDKALNNARTLLKRSGILIIRTNKHSTPRLNNFLTHNFKVLREYYGAWFTHKIPLTKHLTRNITIIARKP